MPRPKGCVFSDEHRRNLSIAKRLGPNHARHTADGITRIYLNRGQVALIDTTDWDLIRQYRWHAAASKSGLWYVRTNAPRSSGKPHRAFSMHHLLLPDAIQVDHRDGDGLNNRRSNLRPSTQALNNFNRRQASVRSSRYHGVSWHKQIGRWRARIQVNGTQIFLGTFSSEAEAYAVRLQAEAQYHPDFPRYHR